MTGEKLGPNFAEALKSGIVLCKLANAVKPGSVRKINNGRMPFMLMENIGFFLDAVTASGIVTADKFQTVDLYEAKNMVQVIRCIHAYARANGHNITSKGQRDPNSDLL